MKVVLATLNAKYIHTSLAIRYLKAYCEPQFPIDLAEYTIKDPLMNITADLYSRKPDVIGFSCYIWNIRETMILVSMLRKVLPNVTIVLGGPEVSYDTAEWMERYKEVDFIIMGEGEATLKELLQELSGERRFNQIAGIARRRTEGDGSIAVHGPRAKLELDTIPTPYRFPEDVKDLPNRIVYFETSRGCPFTCQFCLSSIEVGVRYFSLERTKADLRYLIANGAKLIKFVDRTFNIKRDYALDIFKFLIEEHNGCVFQFEITADIMRPEVLDYLAEHAPPGIFRFEIGVQSTNDATNELVKRKQNFSKLSRTVKRVKESGKIDQHLDLIAGLPEEDYASFRQTFNDVFALGPEELQLGFLKMLRGTGLRASADKYGYTFMDEAPYEMLSNRVLSFDDVIRIKRAEDMLEKYWNAHRLDHSVRYLIREQFPSAFDFFQEFGDYWVASGWGTIGHQLDDLFTRLHQFLRMRAERERQLEDVVALALMKADYLIGSRYKPRKLWWAPTSDKSQQQQWIRALSEQPEVAGEAFTALFNRQKDVFKHVLLERVPFDIGAYFQSGGDENTLWPRETLLIVYYSPEGTGACFFTVPLSVLQPNLSQ